MLSAFLSVLFVCQKQRFIGRVLFHEMRTKDLPSEKAKFRERMHEGNTEFIIPRISMVLLLCASKTFLDYAIVAYVLGLGVYLGFVWQNSLDVDAGYDASRNIFIVFLIFACFYLFIFLIMPDPNLAEWRQFRKEGYIRHDQETANQRGRECGGGTKVVALVSEEGYCGAG
jgi:hypothetical protein